MSSLRGHERREFPLSVRKKAFQRCCLNGTIPGVPQCESCGIELKAGNIEYEHLDADGLGGEPTLENCGVWCRSSCSRKKTSEQDIPRMAKADRVLRKTYGLAPSKVKIQSAGFRKSTPQRSASRPIVRRAHILASSKGYVACDGKDRAIAHALEKKGLAEWRGSSWGSQLWEVTAAGCAALEPASCPLPRQQRP